MRRRVRSRLSIGLVGNCGDRRNGQPLSRMVASQLLPQPGGFGGLRETRGQHRAVRAGWVFRRGTSTIWGL